MDENIVFDFKAVDESSRFARVGLANFIIFVGFCFCFIFYQVVNRIFNSELYNYISLLMSISLVVYFYTKSISRIIVNDEKFTIVRALDTVEIKKKDINKISLYAIPSSVTAYIFIKIKGKLFPSMFYFISINTNYGQFNLAVENLRSKFLEINNNVN